LEERFETCEESHATHGTDWPRRSPDAGDDGDDDRRLAHGAMISDKDDQASSCSGRLLGGRYHMLRVDANAPSRILGTPAARAVRLDGRANGFFFCCPWPLIGFQRRLVEIGKIAHTHLQPPPSPICFPVKPHARRPSRAEDSVSVCRWQVVVSQVKGEHASRWPTRSGSVGDKRQTWSPPQ
jgi:hypothetical protein